jgi:hypothetical protein
MQRKGLLPYVAHEIQGIPEKDLKSKMHCARPHSGQLPPWRSHCTTCVEEGEGLGLCSAARTRGTQEARQK